MENFLQFFSQKDYIKQKFVSHIVEMNFFYDERIHVLSLHMLYQLNGKTRKCVQLFISKHRRIRHLSSYYFPQKKKNLGTTLEFDLCSPLFFFLSFFLLLAEKVLKIAFGKIFSIIVSLHFHSHFTKAQGPDEILIRASWKISTDFTKHQKGLSVFQMKGCNSQCFWPQYIVPQPHQILQTCRVPTSMPCWPKCVTNSKLQIAVFTLALKETYFPMKIICFLPTLLPPTSPFSKKKKNTVFLNILIRGTDTTRCFFL